MDRDRPRAFSRRLPAALLRPAGRARESEHARLAAWGKSLGGRISVCTFDLEPDGSGTTMRWQAEVDAAGIFSGLGSQALGPVATQQAERALERLEKGLRVGDDETPAVPPRALLAPEDCVLSRAVSRRYEHSCVLAADDHRPLRRATFRQALLQLADVPVGDAASAHCSAAMTIRTLSS